jgi:methionyl-tRNA formyltransferase
MRFVVLGTSEFTIALARAVLESGLTLPALVSMPGHARPDNSADIAAFARNNNVSYREVENINSDESLSLLRKLTPDYILCSWPKILQKEVLSIPRKYCIGTHPTQLPFNRGRHPLHWIIVLGIRQTMLSFFHMDEGVDSGKLLVQVPVEIKPSDPISKVISTVNAAAYEGTRLLCQRLVEDPSYDGIAQDHSLANHWRKRTPHDVTVDFRMSAASIVRTVLSFAPPYPCARLIFGRHLIKIVDASIAQMNLTNDELQRMEPGKVISARGHKMRLKAADELVDIVLESNPPLELLAAKYIHPPSKYLSESAAPLEG